jgi:S1-C subfamily serine protease
MAQSLADRYKTNSAAVVRIETSQGIGTGFFVNNDGLLVTSAHVIYERSFIPHPSTPAMTLNARWPASLIFHDGSQIPLPPLTITQRDIENAVFDLAVIETGIKPKCAIPIGEAAKLQIGDHLIAIGFPASAQSGVLYEGFVSSIHTQVPTMIGQLPGTNQLMHVLRDVMRVQMPITAGASGSPVITDSDEAVGVICEIPVQWTQELIRLVQTFANRQNSSGVILSGFDTTKILAELAWIVREFESPGAGIAVPLSYLQQPPTTSSHTP